MSALAGGSNVCRNNVGWRGAFNVLGSDCSPCFSPASTGLCHTSALEPSIPINQSWLFSWSQLSICAHLTQCENWNPNHEHRRLHALAPAISAIPSPAALPPLLTVSVQRIHSLWAQGLAFLSLCVPSSSSKHSHGFLPLLYLYLLSNGTIFSNDHCNWNRISIHFMSSYLVVIILLALIT